MNDAVVCALIVSVGWIFSLCFHEFGHAITAFIGGDRSVKEKGYLSLNPLAYTNLGLSIVLPTLFLFFGGIGLPGAAVMIQTNRLRHRYWSSLVSAAGPFFSMICIALLVGLMKSGLLDSNFVWLVSAAWLIEIELVVTILNLLPIPGLDGFGIIEPFLPLALRLKLRQSPNSGFLFLFFILFFVPGANAALWGAADFFMDLLQVPIPLADGGRLLYRQGSMPIAITIVAIAAVYYLINKQINWYSNAEDLYKKKKFAECSAILDQVLAKGDDARAFRLKALCEQSLADETSDATVKKQHEQRALSLIDRSISMKPDDSESWYARGQIEHALGDLGETIRSHKRALEIDPAASQGFANLATIYLLERRYAELLDLSERRLQAVPQEGVAHFMRGAALGQTGRVKEGLQEIDEAISHGLQTPFTELHKALLLCRLADDARASDSVRYVLASESYNPLPFVQGLLDAGHFKEALALVRLMLTVKPDNPQLKLLQAAAEQNLEST